MQKQKLPGFGTAVEDGEVTNRDGYHQPQNRHPRQRSCGCELTTEKGAYRDVTVELPDGRVAHFYHQTPVVVEEKNGIFRLNSSGYRTSTTKERINRYLPAGYRLIQRDFDWLVVGPDGEREVFWDGMEIEA